VGDLNFEERVVENAGVEKAGAENAWGDCSMESQWFLR